MGLRGPAPMRPGEQMRERDGKKPGEYSTGELKPVDIPEPDENWHITAKRLYQAIRESGQSDFYQNSDWWVAWSMCEDLSYYKQNQILQNKPHAESHKAIYAVMKDLMLTEADRRRANVILQSNEEEEQPASVTVMQEYQKSLNRVKKAGEKNAQRKK